MGVKIFLKNGSGRILLLKRSPERYPHVGDELWDIVGGRIKPGQTLMENLRREIEEEVRMNLEGEPKLVAAQDILKVPGKHVVRLTYIGRAEGEPVVDEDHSEFGWFSLDELHTLGQFDRFAKELVDKRVINEESLRSV